ncbi:hypothetical protein E4U57_004367 [Claviceps arundinis]|uniref:Peptidase S26 domain-containing protein n=1 Tax=Claviceps arundinis TaxID=1623583 RepID=A0A9P7MM26_9HYPO|nr:hypothetical protein E4U57_004367 [Claviceps arundinis]KAG5959060.1 hypothetical protein E4U56_005148 [Claviceps arundinis]
MQHFKRHPIRVAMSFIKSVFFSHLVFSHLFSVDAAEGPSMLPTFTVQGEWFVLDKRKRRGRGIAVGDLVIYKIPMSPNQSGIKRVVGMPGDYVSLGTPGERGDDQMIQVPQGHCWIVGDNLPASRDSRAFGPLPLALVQAKVVGRLLPWDEKTWFTSGLQPLND